jgi:hypothetical protein
MHSGPNTGPLQELLCCSYHLSTEYGTLDFHIDLIEGTHNRLHPTLIYLDEELANGFFCLRRCSSCWIPQSRSGLSGSMQEEELDIYEQISGMLKLFFGI